MFGETVDARDEPTGWDRAGVSGRRLAAGHRPGATRRTARRPAGPGGADRRGAGTAGDHERGAGPPDRRLRSEPRRAPPDSCRAERRDDDHDPSRRGPGSPGRALHREPPHGKADRSVHVPGRRRGNLRAAVHLPRLSVRGDQRAAGTPGFRSADGPGHELDGARDGVLRVLRRARQRDPPQRPLESPRRARGDPDRLPAAGRAPRLDGRRRGDGTERPLPGRHGAASSRSGSSISPTPSSPSGAYPDVAPRIGVTGSGNAGWADAGVLLPWVLHQRTGNVGVIERQYDSMRRFVRFLEADQVDGLRHGGRYGDWLALETPTGLELIGTAYLARSSAIFAGMARLLGNDEDADESARLGRPRPGGVPTSVPRPGALARGDPDRLRPRPRVRAAAPAARSAAAARLAALVQAADDHLLTGFLGTGLVLHALSDHGHHELATRVVRQDTYPGWGYEVRQGATTIWERWNSWTPERRVRRPVDELVQPRRAGLGRRLAARATSRVSRPERPATGRCSSDLGPAAGHRWAERRMSRPMATIRSNGRPIRRRLEITVDVPPNTFADRGPPRDDVPLTVNGRSAATVARGLDRPSGTARLSSAGAATSWRSRADMTDQADSRTGTDALGAARAGGPRRAQRGHRAAHQRPRPPESPIRASAGCSRERCPTRSTRRSSPVARTTAPTRSS